MPFDYTYLSCDNIADIWEQNPSIDLVLRVSSKSGEIKDGGSKTANPNGFRLNIGREEWGKRCSIKGSLHKAFKGQNHDRFTFSELCTLVNLMADKLHIDPKATIIHSLEIQLNLFLDESPQNFIKSAITHKGKAFNEINPRQPNVGRIAAYDDREIKIYDKYRADLAKARNKAERNKIKASISNPNILRFGVAVKKMRYLEKYNIQTLSDLTDLDKVIGLTSVLFNEIKHIKFFDHTADTSPLTELQRLKWERFSNPFYWTGLNYRERESASKMFSRICSKLDTRNYNDDLIEFCFKEYIQIFEAYNPKKWRCLHLLHEALRNSEAEKMAVFTHLSSYVESPPSGERGGHPTGQKTQVQNTPQKTQKTKRVCVSCGRDISHQKAGSKFCSENHYGKQAKRCRNKASNTARKTKLIEARKIETEALKLLTREYLYSDLKITYTRNDGKRTRTNSQKIKPVPWKKRQKIISVRVKAPPPLGVVTLTTLRAKKFIKTITTR